ncbi:hypothetical protein B0H11DRAFT_2224050 [Mycena galericulata]|nr:hypothetical protein B0H11DRAFT_2224050 [Mycena galericulata]
MASSPSSAVAGIMVTLRDSVLPALNLAKTGVTGIGIPGVEGAINGVYELAKMVSTMKDNKKGLAALQKSVDGLAALKVLDAPMDLKKRLTELSGKMANRAQECTALGTKLRIDRFLRIHEYAGKILDIRNRVAEDIHEFTVCSTIPLTV